MDIDEELMSYLEKENEKEKEKEGEEKKPELKDKTSKKFIDSSRELDVVLETRMRRAACFEVRLDTPYLEVISPPPESMLG